jgi:hypothetical protein
MNSYMKCTIGCFIKQHALRQSSATRPRLTNQRVARAIPLDAPIEVRLGARHENILWVSVRVST